MKQLLRNIYLAVSRFLTLPKRCAAAEAMVEKLRANNKTLAADLERCAAEMRMARDGSDVAGLTLAQIERLAMLAEECGEVVQAVGKILRHGYHSGSPFGGPSNRVHLERELGDVRSLIAMMFAAGDIRAGDVRHWQYLKDVNVRKWTHHQG